MFFFFKQKTAYEIKECDWSSDVCSSDLIPASAQSNAKYYLHRTILSIIRKLKDSNGAYLFQAPTGTLPGTIWNKPYVLSEVMPTVSATAVSTKLDRKSVV